MTCKLTSSCEIICVRQLDGLVRGYTYNVESALSSLCLLHLQIIMWRQPDAVYEAKDMPGDMPWPTPAEPYMHTIELKSYQYILPGSLNSSTCTDYTILVQYAHCSCLYQYCCCTITRLLVPVHVYCKQWTYPTSLCS